MPPLKNESRNMLPSLPLPNDILRPPETTLANITPQETRDAPIEEKHTC